MNKVTEQQARLRISAINQYNRYYQTVGELRDTDAFYHWVLDKLGVHHGTLLDVACGEGHLVRFARKRTVQAFGIDYSPVAIASANKQAGSPFAFLGDGETLPFADQSFDYVTNLGSLEHFESPAEGLAEMKRIVKITGRIGLVLPNSFYLLDIIWHVWRRGYPVTHRQTIERFATAGQWRDMIEQNGLRVIEAYKYNLCAPVSLHDLKWYGRSPLRLVSPLLSPLTPFNLSYSFLFICSPI